VSDHITNLEWTDDSNAVFLTKNWTGAVAYCNSLNLGGYTDWRLPTRNELHSLSDYNKIKPTINSIFTNVAFGNYWSSTVFVGSSGRAWDVTFIYGNHATHNTSLKQYVRCVRTEI